MRMCLILITSLYAERWLTDNWLSDGLNPLMPWWMTIPIANSQAQTFIQWCLWETAEGTLILGWWETGTVVIPPLRYTYAHFWLVAGIKPDWVLDSPVWLLVLQEMENLWSLMPAPYVNPVVCVQLCWGGAWSLVPCLCSRDKGLRTIKEMASKGTWAGGVLVRTVRAEMSNSPHFHAP